MTLKTGSGVIVYRLWITLWKSAARHHIELQDWGVAGSIAVTVLPRKIVIDQAVSHSSRKTR
jgi:hypothetical protein